MSDMNFEHKIEGEEVLIRFGESHPFVPIWDFSPATVEQARFVCHWIGVQFQLFGKSQVIPELKLPDLSTEESLTFFPGTFSPWHQGHLACLDLTPREKIIVCPDLNPWKVDDKKECPWQVYKTLRNYLKDTNYIVYPGFLAKKSENPTVSWLPKVQVENKDLIIGDDSFESLPQWKDASQLIKNIRTLFVCPRHENQDLLKSSLDWVEEHNSNCEVVTLNNHDYQHLSSTELRED
ncbi:MAG: hypothetical protein GY909_00865 [Oligoflexia bacterium]|nr:hypothetical protein [Oligoflexia bacterium]